MKLKKLITLSLTGVIAVGLFTACANNTEAPQGVNTGTGLPPVSELVLMEQTGVTHEHIYQSDYFTETGFFKDLNTVDYISMGDYSGIEIPQDILQVEDAVIQAEMNAILSNAGIVLNSQTELTDEYIAQISGGQYQTVDTFKEDIERNLLTAQKSEYLNQALMELSTFNDLPESLTDYYSITREDEIFHMAEQYGMTRDGLLLELGFESMDAFLESEKANIENQVKFVLIVQMVAEELEIEVTTSDIDNYFSGGDWSSYKEAWGENYIKSLVLTQKVYDYFN